MFHQQNGTDFLSLQLETKHVCLLPVENISATKTEIERKAEKVKRCEKGKELIMSQDMTEAFC